MNFGIMFFSGSSKNAEKASRFLFDAVQYADENDLSFVFTPERHFHEFGGLFPNPSVTSAALAMVTKKIKIRAGSLISPLHDSIRIAEEWSLVDNFSNGRAAISFGSGWNINDFVFHPEVYSERQIKMYQQIEEVKNLWAGGKVVRKNSAGKDVEIVIQPKPVQPELQYWVTSSGNVDTFESAGAIGANLLTHLIGQDLSSLEEKISVYRRARSENDFDPETGIVTLMLHTFIGGDVDSVREKVREPFREYLRTAVNLELVAASSGGVISGGHKIETHEIEPEDMEDLLDMTFERYFRTGALMGTVESCQPFIEKLRKVGVNEAACLIDFIDDFDAILTSLTHLKKLAIQSVQNTVVA